MALATEPIGSIPRPRRLLEGINARAQGRISQSELDTLYEEAVGDTIASFEETGSPVVTDGEQRKPSFATYPIAGLETLAPDGVVIPFADGHTRQLPRLTAGPFRYRTYAGSYLEAARPHARVPLKQAVISASGTEDYTFRLPFAGACGWVLAVLQVFLFFRHMSTLPLGWGAGGVPLGIGVLVR